MATHTLGTNATTSIPLALPFLPGYASGMAPADIASLANAMKDDQNVAHLASGQLASFSEGFSSNGVLLVPNRGVLKLLPGDWVGVDSRGWPILLSADTIANGLWTHS